MVKSFFKKLGKTLSFVVLDFNRPQCAELCLQSIKDRVKFDNYEVIFYSNGGQQDYVGRLYGKGLIDKCILSTKNEGSGFATPRAAEFVQTDFFINLQCDNMFIRDFTLEEFLTIKKTFKKDKRVGALNLFYCEKFSERAYIINTKFYCQNTMHEGGGAGPYFELGKNSETTTQEWVYKKGKTCGWWSPEKPLIGDIGKYAINEFPCGGSFVRRCDTQELTVVVAPKKRYDCYNLSSEEWDLILANKWPAWTIPKASIPWVFFYFSNEFEDKKNEIYRRS